MNSDSILSILCSYQFRFAKEAQLHDAIAAALTERRITFEREVRLNERDRVDFLAGDVAIECKVDGSRIEVMRQLLRYAESPRVGSILLVTSRSRHLPIPTTLGGKPVSTLWLNSIL